MLDLLRQGQGAQKVGEVAGERMQLESHRVVPEGMAGQPGPADRVFALLDVLFSGAAAVVELHHPLIGPAQVGHDEADPR
jgi:hypothetical protein